MALTPAAAKIKEGMLTGYGRPTRVIDAVISWVFIFEDLAKAIKLYKPDNDYFEIGKGKSRIDFISKDFSFNRLINPDIYLRLCALEQENGSLRMVELGERNDDLVIVMNLFDPIHVLTHILHEGQLTRNLAFEIGKQCAEKRMALRGVREDSALNWWELLISRANDIETWPSVVPEFDREVALMGISKIRDLLKELEPKLRDTPNESLQVSTDCIAENAYIENGKIYFFDAYYSKPDWRLSDFGFDLAKIAGDIYALTGKEYYDLFMEGVKERTEESVDPAKEYLYRLYACMVMNLYLYVRSRSDVRYKEIADKYFKYTKALIET
jgi:aminoglycoside phosphotransferase family enzyme